MCYVDVMRLKHGMSGTLIYHLWSGMKGRCTNKKLPLYKFYGARGIKVCERWLKFENFYEDFGRFRPVPHSKYSIDRINPDGDYCLENCRWATDKQQGETNRGNRNPGRTLYGKPSKKGALK